MQYQKCQIMRTKTKDYKTERLMIRLSASEKKALIKKARAANMTMTDYLINLFFKPAL